MSRRGRSPERPIGGSYSQFKWGKFDAARRENSVQQRDRYNEIFNTDFFRPGHEMYPNLTRAYLEATGAEVHPTNPITARERIQAIYDYGSFMSEEYRQREAQRAQDEANGFAEADAKRRQVLRDEYDNSSFDESNSDDAEADAAHTVYWMDHQAAIDRERDEFWMNSDHQQELAADHEEDAVEAARINAQEQDEVDNIDDLDD